MTQLLSRFAHREGYTVHIDPMSIAKRGYDAVGPVIALHDGTVLKLMPERQAIRGDVAVALREQRMSFAKAH